MNARIRKTQRILEQQDEVFRQLDAEIDSDRLLPAAVRRQWKKLQRLHRMLHEEGLPYIGEASGTAEPGDGTWELLRRFFEHLKGRGSGLQEFLAGLAHAIEADRGMLIACSEASSQVRLLSGVHVSDPNLTLDEFQISRTVFREVMRFRQSVLIPNALADPDYSAQQSIVQAQAQSILATPVLGSEGVAGILYFESSKIHRGFTPAIQAFVEAMRPMLRLFFWPGHDERVPTAKGVFLEQEKVSHGLIGQDPAFRQAMALLQKGAPAPATLLLNGESGTGKELFARAAHAMSPRKRGPFVAVNCAAIPEALLESELFGHEKGAFTGADAPRMGKVERAHQGTLFLDEVSELKLELQAKLLRVLQSHELERVGGRGPIAVDVRVIAATNRDLLSLIQEGKFRQDLYFRLNVFPIDLPPLRKRPGDIRPLANHFLQKYADLVGLRLVEVQPEVWSRLEAYAFPGNVRELENLIYRALLLSDNGRVTIETLPQELAASADRDMDKNPFSHLLAEAPQDYAELCRRRESVKEICRRETAFIERRFAERLVEAAGGNVSQAAREAGIDRGLFYRLLNPDD